MQTFFELLRNNMPTCIQCNTKLPIHVKLLLNSGISANQSKKVLWANLRFPLRCRCPSHNILKRLNLETVYHQIWKSWKLPNSFNKNNLFEYLNFSSRSWNMWANLRFPLRRSCPSHNILKRLNLETVYHQIWKSWKLPNSFNKNNLFEYLNFSSRSWNMRVRFFLSLLKKSVKENFIFCTVQV